MRTRRLGRERPSHAQGRLNHTVWSRVWLVAVLVALAVPAGAQDSTSGDVVSTQRVMKGLQVQEPLRIPPPPADVAPVFRVEIKGERHLETALDAARRDIAGHPFLDAGPTTSPLLFQVDVLPAIVGAVRSVQKARYEAAERRIHAEVSAEHAQFCEANDCSQINEGLVLPKRTP